MSLSPVPSQSYALPPCIYPSSKPYSGFTTLLHRFGRYERIRFYEAEEERLLEHGDGWHAADESTPAASTNPGSGSLERIRQQLGRSESAGLRDQRVSLTPKQEIKMELARLGAAVEKLRQTPVEQAGATSGFQSSRNLHPTSDQPYVTTTQQAPTKPAAKDKDRKFGLPFGLLRSKRSEKDLKDADKENAIPADDLREVFDKMNKLNRPRMDEQRSMMGSVRARKNVSS